MKINRQFTLLNLTGMIALILVTSGVFWMWFMLTKAYTLQQSMSQIQMNLISTINQIFVEFKYEDTLDRSFEEMLSQVQLQLGELQNIPTEAQVYQRTTLASVDSVLALYRQLSQPNIRIAEDIRMHLEDKLLFQLHALFDDSVILTQLIVNHHFQGIRQFGLWAISAVLAASLVPVLTHRSISLKLNYTVRTIQTTLGKVKQGDFSARSTLIGSDELVQLADEIDEMIATLQQLTVSKHELETIVEERTAALQKLSYTDNLTGIANRRALMINGTRELAKALRNRHELCVLMIDLDYFKRVNDTLGHEQGDWALRAVCKTIAEQLREGDLFARLGGEEFIALLTATELSGAIELAQRVRTAVERRFCQETEPVLRLTISIGVAALKASGVSTIDGLIAMADRQLYAAKKSGRNCVRPSQQLLTHQTLGL